MFNLGKISYYRMELMGIATIMIIICHASQFGVVLPLTVRKIAVLGNYGVEVFFFLSGMGMSYSLRKSIKNSKWLYNRIIRVMIPYLAISIPWYGIRAMIYNESIWYFLLNVTTINYWLWHKGAWFIAVLLPLYVITPALFTLFNKKYGFVWVVLFVVVTSSLSLINTDHSVLNNLLFALHRLPCYFIGLYIARYISMNVAIPYWTIFFGSIGLMFLLRLINIGIGWIWPSIFLLIVITIYLLKIFPRICPYLRMIGEVSLESYIMNIALGDLFPQFSEYNSNGYIRYSMIVIIGIATAFVVNRYISKPVINYLSTRINNIY